LRPDLQAAMTGIVTFPTYDPETDSIQLNGIAVVMLTVILKAKFGDKFDPETLFHPGVAKLVKDLHKSTQSSASDPEIPMFNRDDLFAIGRAVFDDSDRLGWWSMTSDDRVTLLQDAASPWVLREQEIEVILGGIENSLHRAQAITAAAEAGR
jgi:hypothetical protein